MSCAHYVVRGRALDVHQGGATHVAVLWRCMWGRGPRGTMPLAPFSAVFKSLPPLPTSKLGPSGADSRVGGFVYILGPCGSLQRSQESLWHWEFLPLPPQLPQVFSVREFDTITLHWTPGLCGLSCSPVVLPGLSAGKCGTTQSAICYLYWSYKLPPCRKSSLPWLPVSAPPTGLDECFFFKSLVVGLPYSLIFWQFSLFFVFKFVVLLVVRGSKVNLPTLPSQLEVSHLRLTP